MLLSSVDISINNFQELLNLLNIDKAGFLILNNNEIRKRCLFTLL